MPGVLWHIFAFGALGVFLIVITYRTLAIIRLPVHLRWELAPIPHEKGKGRYGGSHLEEYEWWSSPQRKTRIAPLVYMAKEIFLLRSIWRHQRALWPFSFLLHMGIYLVIGMLLLQVANALFMVTELPSHILAFSLRMASAFALGGYLLGSLGAIGLILKRALDLNFRPFSTISKYVNLLFLGTVFISGGYAWLRSGDFASAMGYFIRDLITFNPGIAVAFPLSLHLALSLLLLLYVPLTDMIHFIAKYFTYHEIRWNDRPRDEKMEEELRGLLSQPVTWSAPHIGDGQGNWVDIAAAETSDEKEP